MTRIFQTVALALTTILLLSGCRGGDVRACGRQICPSEQFSESEISNAMDLVEETFRKEFDGCTLRSLVYDEAVTGQEAAEWARQYGAEETIVLISSFDVDESGGDGSLNPNSRYENWKWILTRSGGRWELQTWGYG